MTRRGFVMVLVGVVAWLGASGVVRADEKDDLKARFKERHATLMALKRAEKVGETYKGLAGVVKKEYASDPAGDSRQTIAAFLAAENKDRVRLYELIARETGSTPAAVAKRDAERRFKAAKPEEFLQPREGEWVRKKDL